MINFAKILKQIRLKVYFKDTPAYIDMIVSKNRVVERLDVQVTAFNQIWVSGESVKNAINFAVIRTGWFFKTSIVIIWKYSVIVRNSYRGLNVFVRAV